VLLQLAQAANHQCVLKVASDAGFEQRHVVIRELGETLFKQAPNTAVRGLLSVL